jgi:hypothetical protein
MAGTEKRGSNRRRQQRWPLFLYLRVYDVDGGALLGHMVDVHDEGMMLVSRAPIPLDHDYHLKVELPTEMASREPIRLRARSVRRNRDLNPELYDTGFALTSVSPPQTARLRTLIEDLRFDHRPA